MVLHYGVTLHVCTDLDVTNYSADVPLQRQGLYKKTKQNKDLQVRIRHQNMKKNRQNDQRTKKKSLDAHTG